MPPKAQQRTTRTGGQQPPPSSVQDAPINESAADNSSTPSGIPRPGVTRLDSLARRGGSSPAPRTLKIKPKASAGRRSVQEREEAEREEQRRLETKNTGSNVSGSSSNTGLSGEGRGGFFGGRGWQRGGGWFGGRGGMRAGYAMPPPERVGEGMASGPFGGGSILTAQKKRLTSGVGRERTTTTTSSSSRSRQKVKTDKEGDVSMSDGQTLKHENLDEQGWSSANEDEEKEGPRMDIKFIDLISDDEELKEGDEETIRGKRPIRRPNRGLRPVRLATRERVKRGTGGPGLERSFISSTTDQKQAGSPEPLSLSRGLELEKGRRRVKGKEVEFLRDSKIYKGVYQTEEEEQFQVKSEPVDGFDPMSVDDFTTSDSTQAGASASAIGLLGKDVQPVSKGLSKPRSKARVKMEIPVFQAEEDRDEWVRHKEDVEMLSQELGLLPLGTGEEDVTPRNAMVDKEGDTEMQTPALSQKSNAKYGRLYLFQFPPILPPLQSPTSKPEPQNSPPNEHQTTTAINIDSNSTNQPPPSTTSQKTKANPSEAVIVDDSNKQADTKPATATPRFPSGKVGKLTLRKSGRVALSWGIHNPSEPPSNLTSRTSSEKRGLQFQISRGTDVEFVQNVVLADNVLVKQEDHDDDKIMGGLGDKRRPRGIALGTLVGKMVATPDWESLLR